MTTASHAIQCNNNGTFSVVLLDGSQYQNVVTTFGEFAYYYEAFDSANADSQEASDCDAVFGRAICEYVEPSVPTVTVNLTQNDIDNSRRALGTSKTAMLLKDWTTQEWAEDCYDVYSETLDNVERAVIKGAR